MQTLKDIACIILALFLFDALGFVLWLASSQTPIDSFYWGGFTGSLLKLFII